MKNFQFFPTLSEYRDYIYTNVFTTPEFKANPFYKGLIEFVIDNRAPIFFEQDRPEEFSHFTQYFNFVLDRKGYYKNEYVKDMYFAHDFVHMCFHNPLRPREMNFHKFADLLNHNEWVASDETEVFTYYRIPEMREKSLDYTIMYDVLQAEGYSKMPSVTWMLTVRRQIIYGGGDPKKVKHPDAEKVFAYLQKFKKNNAVWCKLWYDYFPTIYTDQFEKDIIYLPLLEYDKILESYKSNLSDEEREIQYRKNILRNVQVLSKLIGGTKMPETFEECKEALDRMEGKMVMSGAAKEFHYQYVVSKKKAGENVEKIE